MNSELNVERKALGFEITNGNSETLSHILNIYVSPLFYVSYGLSFVLHVIMNSNSHTPQQKKNSTHVCVYTYTSNQTLFL